MKKTLIIIFSFLFILGLANTISASLGDSSRISANLTSETEPEIRDCFYYFDNQWTGETPIYDCYGCIRKWVDNPRYPFTCSWPW